MKLTFLIAAVCVAVFILQTLFPAATRIFALTPSLALNGWVWQFVTYMFLHGDIVHLTLNMFVLLIFGVMTESALGRNKFLILFFVAGIGSGIVYLMINFALNPAYAAMPDFGIPMLGASGAIFGIMAAYGVLYPRNWIIMFPGIPMPAIVAVGAFALLEIFYGLTGSQPGIANWGHIGGLAIGLAFILYWKHGRSRPKILASDSDQEDKDWEFVWE